MKWLVIQSDGEHKGQDGWTPNWFLRECYAIKSALVTCGHSVDIWGLRHDNFATPPDFNAYDGVFTIENYELGWLPDLRQTRAVKLFWLIDAHWQPVSCFESVLPQYDVVLHSTRRFIGDYSVRFPNQKHLYFPNGVDDRFFSRELYPDRPHRKPLIFIGGKAAPRAGAINTMIEHAGLDYRYAVTGLDYIHAILDAKIQFNKGLNGDINYRNWETIGLGTCLLTEYDPEMEALGFKDDENCLFYRTVEEAVHIARVYTNSEAWMRIAEGGYQLSKAHPYSKRISDLMHQIQ